MMTSYSLLYYSLGSMHCVSGKLYFTTHESTKEQTIEEKYHSYLTASISSPGTNMLKFFKWAVSGGKH